MDTQNVVFALHDRSGQYWTYVATALTSVLCYASVPVRIHVLHDATLCASSRQRLTQVATRMGAQGIEFIPAQLPAELANLTLGPFSVASLYRLLIPRLFPQEPLVLYLDADLVFNGVDIHELAYLAPADSPLSGVLDPHIHRAPGHVEQHQRLGLDTTTYINSGVLCIRPKLIPEDPLDAFVRFGQRFGAVSHPDQDFLNWHFQGRIGILPPHLNFQAGLYQRALLEPLSFYDGKIIHYAGKMKPLDGMMAPGFQPFWRHTFLVPEITSTPALLSAPRYLFPVEGDMHGLRRVLMREQPASTR